MRGLTWLIAIAVFAGLCWFFPLFHVVPLERAARERAEVTFNPEEFTERFWNEHLVKSFNRAVDADVLLPAIQKDAAEAKVKFSHGVGVSDSYTYFISGKGRVLVISDEAISLTISDKGAESEISLQTGLIFGNAIRDCTGLLNVNDFPNSQDFNGVSEALNHIVETRVLPKLREQAKVGATVSFVGCAEVGDESTDLKPLKVVPIQAEIQ